MWIFHEVFPFPFQHVRESLVVDAAQGVEAQTLSNVYLALDQDLEIITVLNKIDLPYSDPQIVLKEVEDVIGLDTSAAVDVLSQKW